MEEVVSDDSPLAAYLEGQGSIESLLGPVIEDTSVHTHSTPWFAPRGKPTVQPNFRSRLPPPLRLNVPQNTTVAAIYNACSKAVNSRLGRVDNAKFLERFRYVIVASQLLDELSYHGQDAQQQRTGDVAAADCGPFTLAGVASTATIAFICAYCIHWIRSSRNASTTTGRLALILTIFWGIATVTYAYMKRQWLQYLRQQTLSETSTFVAQSQNLNRVIAAAMTLIQEVELVSRGYRLSTPLPPISRLEDRGQNRRCIRLRKALRARLGEVLPRYNQACLTLKPLAELIDLEKYFDVYDINELDLEEASLGFTEDEFEDSESLKVLKILVARFHTIRKVLLCCMLALDADGGKPDFTRWGTTVDELRALCVVTEESEDHLRRILSEEESHPIPPTPKLPLTPGRERWRSQLRKLNTLSSGIRSLQAKMHVLREESGKALDESEDLTELGPILMSQYESIGCDLRVLMQEWEDGRERLAENIERNHKRISSLSVMGDAKGGGMLSPTTSLSGLTSVEEGGSPFDALKALNGELFKGSRLSGGWSSEEADVDVEEVFEAVAVPKTRDRSSLTREERITRMRDERERRESLRDIKNANTHMLRELESVINLRPRGKTASGRNPALPLDQRVTSL